MVRIRCLVMMAMGLALLSAVTDAQAIDLQRAVRTVDPLFCQVGTQKPQQFSGISSDQRFDVVNAHQCYLLLVFVAIKGVSFEPPVISLAPRQRQTVTMLVVSGAHTFTFSYLVTEASTPFVVRQTRYCAGKDADTDMFVPVRPELHAAMLARARSIVLAARMRVTDKSMPNRTYIYTPGPTYPTQGLFPREFLRLLEGAGRYLVTADEVKRAVDFLARKQLADNTHVGACTYPKGAIPDHLFPDGRVSWGTDAVPEKSVSRRPSMDASLCFILLAWHYGDKVHWNRDWQRWFAKMARRFDYAWYSVPRNASTGLVTQWSTPGHVGAHGITETNGAAVTWRFHDDACFPGDNLGASVLACNAAGALADMYEQIHYPVSTYRWSVTQQRMREAIRAQFRRSGYLPCSVGAGAPTVASPGLTGYAVWSGILTETQADAASDWLAAQYRVDKSNGGSGEVFQLTAGLRGAARMCCAASEKRKPVVPHRPDNYWYAMSLGIARTLARRHPAEAREWVENAYRDILSRGNDAPCEYLDGATPTHPRYNAAVAAILGIGLPCHCLTLTVTGVDRRPALALVRRETDPMLCVTGTNAPQRFTAVSSLQLFDVVNHRAEYILLSFAPNTCARLTPSIVRLAPGARRTITMRVNADVKTFSLSYAVAYAPTPFPAHQNRYRAYNAGETVMCVPVPATLHGAMRKRALSILDASKVRVTLKRMPANTYIYTPGPYYQRAGLFARDLLFQLEGAGQFTVTAEEVKRAVDLLALMQLSQNSQFADATYPKGAIPDHIMPDGRFRWGVAPLRLRPSMDEAMCFITLGWHYGYKAQWSRQWKAWFREKAHRFADAWNSVPRNPTTGLVTQWTTPGHIGAQGIRETNGACVMWGFHDSYGFPGDDLGTSVLACNAARALADMYDHAADPTAAKAWSTIADAMRNAIRAQFNPAGYLPWGVGKGAPAMASPDITGYAVWSGILTDAQADAASDWLASCYNADKLHGGAADLFLMTIGRWGAVRMARKSDDLFPDAHIWPHVDTNHWENPAYGYNAYQDGGYWYYMSLGIATTLWRKHPADAREWAYYTYTDIVTQDSNHPYERIDGFKPVNCRYNASIGALLGIGMPATSTQITVMVK